MEVRDAVEDDAQVLADLAGVPADVMRNVVHDRTVRVLVDESGAETESEAEGEDGADVEGFVSFDVRDGTVHVTQFAGDRDVCERLLTEPIDFARSEDFSVEVLVTEADEEMRAAVEAKGFEETGAGPRFEGAPTTRYRLEP